MNILALIHDKESIGSVLDYAFKIATEGDKIHALNIVSVAGNIPTKKTTGEIIDGCTEFDVSAYYNERRDNQIWIDDAIKDRNIETAQSIIGSRYEILKAKVSEFEVNLIVTSTEQTSGASDWLKNTTAGIAHDKTNVPVLAFKCDRSKEDLKNIAILSDFEQPEKEDLSILKNIIAKSNATVSLYSFVQDDSEISDAENKMDKFIAEHKLENAKKVVVTTKHKAKSAEELLIQYPMELMVLMDIRREGINKILKGDLEKDILNHNLIPILAY